MPGQKAMALYRSGDSASYRKRPFPSLIVVEQSAVAEEYSTSEPWSLQNGPLEIERTIAASKNEDIEEISLLRI